MEYIQNNSAGISKIVKYIVSITLLATLVLAVGGYVYLQKNGFFDDGKTTLSVEDTTPLTQEEISRALDSLQSGAHEINVNQANKILSQMPKVQFKPTASQIQEAFDSLK